MLETQRNTSYVYLSSRVVGEPRCSAETIQGVAWSTTAQGGTDIQPCPSGARGKPSVHSVGHLQILISLYFKASLHVFVMNISFHSLLRLELVTITTICTQTRLEREAEGNSEMVY